MSTAGYVLLRLPHEVAPLFRNWLDAHYPDRAEHVMSLVRQSRGGRDNDSDFAQRMTGRGVFADMIAKRFRLACRRHGLDERERFPLDTAAFRPPWGFAAGVVLSESGAVAGYDFGPKINQISNPITGGTMISTIHIALARGPAPLPTMRMTAQITATRSRMPSTPVKGSTNDPLCTFHEIAERVMGLCAT